MVGATITPFHTFTPIRSDLIGPLITALNEAHEGNDEPLQALLSADSDLSDRLKLEGCDLTSGRKQCQHNDSHILFVAVSAVDSRGERMRPYDDGKSRERLGRFPWADGNPLTYFRAFSGDPERSEFKMMQLIVALDERLTPTELFHERLEDGPFGKLHGWLDYHEVEHIERALSKSMFNVSADEPLDGAVAEIARYLTLVLRAAHREQAGILLSSL